MARRIVSAEDISILKRDRDTFRDASLVMVRFATHTGIRTDLDRAMELLSLTRAGLETEPAAEVGAREPA